MSSHHSHHPINYTKIFLVGIILKTGLILLEVYYGITSNSVALISDAFHNATDSLSLFITWGSYLLSKLKPSDRYTFGFKNTTIMGAFINAVLILVGVGGILWEASLRFEHPQAISINEVIGVAAFGLLINGLVAAMFMVGKKDINIWSAFLHMASDAVMALGVLIAALLIHFTQLYWIDSVASIIIAVLILVGSWSLFKESLNLLLNAAPETINVTEIKKYLLTPRSVNEIHDLHIWAISSTEIALSVHLVLDSKANPNPNDLLTELTAELSSKFGIIHTTIQIELAKGLHCQTSCDN